MLRPRTLETQGVRSPGHGDQDINLGMLETHTAETQGVGSRDMALHGASSWTQ